MYNSGINERQNKEKNLIKLAAMRQLYSDAKFLFKIKFFICTALVIIGSLIGISMGKNALIHNVSLLIKVNSAIAPFLLFDKWINNKKELAATIQEEFDNTVLQTLWNEKKYGAKGIHNQEIIYYQNKYAKKCKEENWQTKLINWYDSQFSLMPLSLGRVYCQATNINWDKELRIKF